MLIEPGPLDGPTFESMKNELFDLNLGAEWLNDWAWNSQFLSPDDHARMDYERMLGLKDSQPRYHQRMDVDPAPFWRLGAAANKYLEETGMTVGKTELLVRCGRLMTEEFNELTPPLYLSLGLGLAF